MKNGQTTGAQKFAELKNMLNEQGQKILHRLRLAAELLSDAEWLMSTKNDEGAARDLLEDECFGDLCGALTLGQLLRIYQHFPNEADWKESRWNLKSLIVRVEAIESKGKDKPTRAPIERVTIKERDELVQEREHFKAVADNNLRKFETASREVNLAKSKERDYLTEIRELKAMLHDLKVENAHLKGRLEELERAMERQMVA
jgi:hypothetical protein